MGERRGRIHFTIEKRTFRQLDAGHEVHMSMFIWRLFATEGQEVTRLGLN